MEIKKYMDEQYVNEILKTIYPVGSIYISTVNTNPNILFGFGTWEQIEDVFLLSAGSQYSGGSTGGEATVTLSINEMPKHSHQDITVLGWPVTEKDENVEWSVYYQSMNSASFPYAEWQHTKEVGESQPHNNMPPYLVVYMFKRID